MRLGPSVNWTIGVELEGFPILLRGERMNTRPTERFKDSIKKDLCYFGQVVVPAGPDAALQRYSTNRLKE